MTLDELFPDNLSPSLPGGIVDRNVGLRKTNNGGDRKRSFVFSNATGRIPRDSFVTEKKFRDQKAVVTAAVTSLSSAEFKTALSETMASINLLEPNKLRENIEDRRNGDDEQLTQKQKKLL